MGIFKFGLKNLITIPGFKKAVIYNENHSRQAPFTNNPDEVFLKF